MTCGWENHFDAATNKSEINVFDTRIHFITTSHHFRVFPTCQYRIFNRLYIHICVFRVDEQHTWATNTCHFVSKQHQTTKINDITNGKTLRESEILPPSNTWQTIYWTFSSNMLTHVFHVFVHVPPPHLVSYNIDIPHNHIYLNSKHPISYTVIVPFEKRLENAAKLLITSISQITIGVLATVI